MRGKLTARISRRDSEKAFGGLLAASLVAVLIVAASASARRQPAQPNTTHPDNRLTSDLTGSVPTHDGDHIRVKTDLGSINIHTQDSAKSGTVDYHVHLETDGSQKDAQQLLKSFTISARATSEGVLLKAEGPERRGAGRLWVTLDLQIPRNSSVDVSTGGGSIDSSEIEGRVTVSPASGHITAKKIS